MTEPQDILNEAVVAHQLGRLADAERVYLEVLRRQPNRFDALHLLGVIALQTGRTEWGIELIGKAIRLDGTIAAAHTNMGNGLRALKRHQDALKSYLRAIELKPDNASAYYNLGVALRDLKRHEEAVASFNRAITLRPDHAEAWYNRGVALSEMARDEEAITCFEKVTAIDPDHRFARGAHLAAAQRICDWARTGIAMKGDPERMMPFTLLGQIDDPSLHLRCARKFGQEASHEKPWTGTVRRHDKIRIAYLSADFRDHAVAYQIAGLFESHDRSKFEVTGVSIGGGDSGDTRARLVGALDRFHDARSRSDLDVATLLNGLEIDIAVDLAGYTGSPRPGILARRPAPIQVSYLGYPGTLGSGFMDYVIADKTVLPFDQQPYYTERIVHLPECYQVNDSKRIIAGRVPERREMGLPDQGFVFCCFNHSYKITAPVFDVWMRLLKAAEGSVLWLVRDNDAAERNLRREAAERGIDPARLVFADRRPVAEHLARHRLADLFLDTLPYNAHGTASFALWAGLPIVTCQGHAFAGRVAASLLRAVGLPDLVTNDLAEYETLASRLAADATLLGEVRERLRGNRLNHPLFDTDRFSRHIESAYTTMWELWQRGEPPRSFSVEPLRCGTVTTRQA